MHLARCFFTNNIEKNGKSSIVATSRKTRGGISSVVRAHMMGAQWRSYKCRWIETHKDKGYLVKLFILIRGIFLFLLYIPISNVVHIHLSESISAKREKIFFVLAKLFRKKTIIHFHSFSPETTICGPHRELYHYLYSKTDFGKLSILTSCV